MTILLGLMGKLGRNQLMIIALLVASLSYVAYESAYATTFNLTWANHIQYDDNWNQFHNMAS